MDWQSGLPAYSEYLTPEQIDKVYQRREYRIGSVLYNASAMKPREPSRYATDEARESYERSLERWESAQEEFGSFRQQFPTLDESRKHLISYWRSRGFKFGAELHGRLIRLRQLYDKEG